VKCRFLLLVLLASLLTGCGRGSETLDAFSARWHSAINAGKPEQLYDLLDAQSQRRIRTDLETMRGLSEPQQKAVIERLGGEKVKDLQHLSPQRYFGRLWDRTFEGRKPTMAIEARGGESAYMLVGLDGGRRERFRLMVEGGRWVWVLPEQRFGAEATARLPGP
jgi:hypothetical protein